MKKALITGILGQDGSYLAEYLVEQDYQVFGMVRRAAGTNRWWQEVKDKPIELVYGDLRDELSLDTAIRKSWPDEIYNLAGVSSLGVSWSKPAETLDINAGGLARILKIVERLKKEDTRIYQAGSALQFGDKAGVRGLCNENTPLRPDSPYAIAKTAAHHMVVEYRRRGMYVVSGFLFNHESPRRGPEAVTKKIATHIAGWKNGDDTVLQLGNLDSRKDWGFAGDYVEAMHSMLQQPEAEDYVIGTGVLHSVREFLTVACQYAGIDDGFVEAHLKVDTRMQRAGETEPLRACITKAKNELYWEPKVDFETLVGMMVHSELARWGAPSTAAAGGMAI